MIDKVDEFNAYRQKMNDKILGENNKVLKRIFNLDTNSFTEGALDKKTKELLGLIASVVLRCDDCVQYHLESSHKSGVSREQVVETLSIGTLIGGTIVIPHLRRAFEYWEVLEAKAEGKKEVNNQA
ncbi:carboxymuconolactone decarboxylase family protein [Mesonia aquimarina]|uniref:carboxymuconolactone decarboxylase family protein n=1 Tax=Mesonia aquimarina TaxID=1504967 RepID=UPI000EF5E864|nr:carboxymuconolactone decarboxylase family protein [Mesonia aquimarina]